jgi:hypothetical protein
MIKSKKAQALPLSRWVLAVTMALLTVSVVGVTLSATLVAINEPQDVRSQAAEFEATSAGAVPTLTSITVEPAEQTTTSPPTPEPLITGLVADNQGESDKATPTSSTSAAIQSFTGSNVTGVRFIYILLGLGILIGGGAFGLIWVVKKVLGGQS